jgi:phage-related protein (TIGR01555 family)
MASKKSSKKPTPKQTQDKHEVFDSFRNFAAGIGYGTNNISSGGTYGYNPITLIRPLLEWMHRGQGLCGTIIDCVADDMTRAGVDIKGKMKPEDIEAINESAVQLGIWNSINDTIKWSRLYGGSLGVFLIDGQDLSTPFRIESVGKGQFKGILPLDRWMVNPDMEGTVNEFGPNFGLPEYYTVVPTAPGLIGMRIHYTRCIRLSGIKLPYWQALTLQYWGESILERIWDILLAFNSSTQGIAQLMYKLHLRTYTVEGLRQLVAAGGPALAGLMAQVNFMRSTQSNEGITLLDGKDKMENFQNNTVSGASDVLVHFLEQISGAVQIPLVRLLGQSPAGLNATGESDLRTYYDEIARQQNSTLKTPVTTVYRCIVQSAGMEWPEGTTIGFKPLWQLNATEKADIATKVTDNVTKLTEAAIISNKTALMEIKQSSDETGFGSNITDEDINNAESEPAPLPETEEVAEIKSEGEIKAEDGSVICPICNGLGRLAVKYSDKTPEGTTRAVLEAVDCSNCDGTGRINTAKDSLERVMAFGMMHGLNIVTENEEGEYREGPNWRALMPADYGYIFGPVGADGDYLDCYVGPDIESQKVFVIDQDKVGSNQFDEHKCMLGFSSREQALQNYMRSFDPSDMGMKIFRSINELSMEEFKQWIEKGNLGQSFGG